MWQKNSRRKGREQHPIPIKKPVSNKKPSLFSSTRKNDATNTQVHSADLFFISLNCLGFGMLTVGAAISVIGS